MTWTSKDELLALSQGWSIFACDDGMIRIQKMDDPPAHAQWKEGMLTESPFSSDIYAISFVRKQAKLNCPTAVKAVRLHNKKVENSNGT